MYCGSCGHFTRHYIWRDGRQARNAPGRRCASCPWRLGHCAHPRMKDRREDPVLPPVDPPHAGPGPAGHPAAGRKRAGPLTAARRLSAILGSPASAAGSGTPPAGRTTAPPAPRSGGGETAAPPHEGTGPGGPGTGFFAPYTVSPRMGWPMCAMWTRIWWVRPGLQSALHIGIAREPLQHGPVGHRAAGRPPPPPSSSGPPGGGRWGRPPCHCPPGDSRSRCTGKSGPGCGPEAGRRASGGQQSFFAAMRRPEVSRSIRWTMPGRSSPPMPERESPQWWSRALTSVPSGWPGAGWTTSPLGLFTTITSLSSYTTSRGMSWGATSTGSGSGRVTDDGLSPAQAVVFRQGLSGSGDPPLLAQPGGGGAGHVRQLPGQPGVQPGAGVLRIPLGASASPWALPLLSYFS